MGRNLLTLLNVWEEFIHFYFLSFVYIIMLIFPKSVIWECNIFVIRPEMTSNLLPVNQLTWLKNVQPSFLRKDDLIGQVTIGNRQQTICIPRNSTILGCTNKLLRRTTCLAEQVEHHNLPLGIVVNQYVAIPKARAIPVIIINTNKYNIWVRQPLLAAELYDAECNQIEYRATMDQEGENINIRFQPVPPQLIDINSCQVEAGPVQPNGPKIKKLKFGP